MRGNEFLDKMELIDPAYVEAADTSTKTKKNKSAWAKWGAMAACLGLIVASTLIFSSNRPTDQTDPSTPVLPQLPTLTLSENTGESMGFEGYMAYDISELINGNPWDEDTEISTLPVYRNTLIYDENFIATGADWEQMEIMLYDVAARLGIEENKLVITDDAPDEEQQALIKEKFEAVGDKVPDGYFDPTKLIGESNGVTIEVSQTMTATIEFKPPVELPEDYHFLYHCSYEDILFAAEYLKETYSELIGTNNPVANIYNGDYNIYQQQDFNLTFYDGSGDLETQIVNYNFRGVAFYPNDDGQLMLARAFNPDLSDKVGDYPIITVEDAKTLLKNGNYITTVPYELPDMENVKKVELLYRNNTRDEYYIPFYRFLVELPEEERDGGMKTYGAYYVPAVHESYISNMPIGDGWQF